MNNSHRSRAIAQAFAKIHWSIASLGMDLVLTPESGGLVEGSELAAALLVIDDVVAELRRAYDLDISWAARSRVFFVDSLKRRPS